MSKPRALIALTLATASILSLNASADTENGAPIPPAPKVDGVVKGSSEVQYLPSAWDRIKDSIYLNLFSNFHGTPTDKPLARKTPNISGWDNNKSTSIYFDTTVVGAYMFNKDVGFGPEWNFFYTPIHNEGMQLQDSGVRIFNNHLIHSGNFNVYGNVILQKAMSGYSLNRGETYGIKTTPHIRYKFGNSGWTTGAFTELKSYLGVTSGKDFKYWALPYVNYDFNDTFGLTVGYEMEAKHQLHTSAYTVTNDHTDLQPGIRWWVKKNFLVSPYVNLYTGNKITAKNSYLGCLISLTL